MSIRLAVSAEMTFLDLPFVDRVRRIDELGFQVEIWDWRAKDIAALAATGATFSSMTGYLTGTLADDDGAAELLRTAELSLAVAAELDCPRLNVHGTGLDPQGLPVLPSTGATPAMWLTAVRTLDRLATLGERAGRVFTLENLNTAVDHPGTPFATAADTRTLVAAVDSPHLKMNLDLYHAQIGEGNLVELVRVRCRTSVRSRSPTFPAGVSRGPGRSTIRRSPVRSSTRLRRSGRAGRLGIRGPRGSGATLPGGVHAAVTASRPEVHRRGQQSVGVSGRRA